MQQNDSDLPSAQPRPAASQAATRGPGGRGTGGRLVATEAQPARNGFEADYNAMDAAVMAVFRVVDAPAADRAHRAELELTPEVHQALQAGHFRLGNTAGLVEAIEAKIEAGEGISGSDAVALDRLSRRLAGGPLFRLRQGGE